MSTPPGSLRNKIKCKLRLVLRASLPLRKDESAGYGHSKAELQQNPIIDMWKPRRRKQNENKSRGGENTPAALSCPSSPPITRQSLSPQPSSQTAFWGLRPDLLERTSQKFFQNFLKLLLRTFKTYFKNFQKFFFRLL